MLAASASAGTLPSVAGSRAATLERSRSQQTVGGATLQRRGSKVSTGRPRSPSKASTVSQDSTKMQAAYEQLFMPTALRQVAKEAKLVDPEEEEPYADWDYELTADDHRLFRKVLEVKQPNYQPAAELVPDAQMNKALKKMLNPARQFNAVLISGDGLRLAGGAAFIGSKPVPRIVLVTGHRGAGGNLGINGIYERYPGDFAGRAIYQKRAEKRLVAAQSPGASSQASSAAPERRPHFHTEGEEPPPLPPPTGLPGETSLPSLTRFHVPKPLPQQLRGEAYMAPVTDPWFLYFEDRQGMWVIGRRPGSREVYARCPGAEELVIDRLDKWQVWEVGVRQWYWHKTLRAVKGGN